MTQIAHAKRFFQNGRGDLLPALRFLGRLYSFCNFDFNEAGGRDFRWQNTLRKRLGPKGHLDWLIIDSNAAKIITVWDYKCTKNMREVSIYSNVNVKSQAGNI